MLARGAKSASRGPRIDPMQLYISIAGLAYFYLSNNDTLSAILAASSCLLPRARSVSPTCAR